MKREGSRKKPNTETSVEMTFLRRWVHMKYYLQCHLFQLHFMASKVSRIMEEITVKDVEEEKLVFLVR